MREDIPTSVIEAAVGRAGAVTIACSAQPITHHLGHLAVTGSAA
jgi:hypothetical protein